MIIMSAVKAVIIFKRFAVKFRAYSFFSSALAQELSFERIFFTALYRKRTIKRKRTAAEYAFGQVTAEYQIGFTKRYETAKHKATKKTA